MSAKVAKGERSGQRERENVSKLVWVIQSQFNIDVNLYILWVMFKDNDLF